MINNENSACANFWIPGRTAAMLLVSVLIVALIVNATTVASACSVPVFRYALLWWNAKRPVDCYQVIVFHRGDLSESQLIQMDRLKKLEWPAGDGANYSLHVFDLNDEEIDEDAKKLWKDQQNATEPWMILRYPGTLELEPPVWAGAFDEAAINRLLDSPKRRELVKRIFAGDSAVWLLLNSGDKAKDQAAADQLAAEIKRLQSELRLPTEKDDQIDTPEDRALEEAAQDPGLPPLRLGFSMIQLDRDDPNEQFLVHMLTHSEPDLETDFRDKPMAFAVFGRGRTLWGLVDKGINPDVIEDACVYLTGMCSCQIKAQNPGFDLLLRVDWEKSFQHQAEDAADATVSVVGARLPGVIQAPDEDTETPTDELTKSTPNSTGPNRDSIAPNSIAPNSIAPNSIAPNSITPNSITPNSIVASGAEAHSAFGDGDTAASDPVPTNSLLLRNSLVALGGGALVLIMLSWFIRRQGSA